MALERTSGENLNHTIVHFELPADNVEKIKEFYQAVFDWKVVDVPNMNYAIIQTVPTDEKGMLQEPGVNGGLYRRINPTQVPINYISVEDIDRYVEKVVNNGGQVVVPKQEIPNVGSIAWVSDPENNVIGLMAPKTTS